MVKRGQAAVGAAFLLIFIVGLLVMFIIFVNPQERARLLGENSTIKTSSSGTSSATVAKNILLEKPGKLDYLAQREIEHPLPVVNIFTRTEAKLLAEKNTVYVKKSTFSEVKNEFPFTIEDLSNTDNVLLTFNIESLEGQLLISLNGQEVFRGESLQSGPITISKNALKANNVMVFEVSSPGLAFWGTNEASLSSIRLVADVTNTKAQESKNTFLISETEKNNLEKIELRFQPDCKQSEVGPLTVELNGEQIYQGVPDCDLAFVPIEFSPFKISEGENKLSFVSDEGTYILSHLTVISKLKAIDYPTYYFDLSSDDYDAIKDGSNSLRLKIYFVDVVVTKTGQVVYNGYVKNFDTKENSYTLDLSDDIEEDTNSLKIKPSKTLEIRELRVDLVD